MSIENSIIEGERQWAEECHRTDIEQREKLANMKKSNPTKKIIKAWIEICQCVSPGCTPTIWNKKPNVRERKNGESFGCKYYPCEIHYQK